MDFNSETMKGARVVLRACRPAGAAESPTRPGCAPASARTCSAPPRSAWTTLRWPAAWNGCLPGAPPQRPTWRRARRPFGANGCVCSSASARPRRRYGKLVYTEPEATMRGRSTLAVRAAYRAWGLEFERKAHEPEDALGLMLAFCSFLMEREIKALEEGDEATAAKAASSLEAFMAEHMLPWASAWRFLVQNHAKTDSRSRRGTAACSAWNAPMPAVSA